MNSWRDLQIQDLLRQEWNSNKRQCFRGRSSHWRSGHRCRLHRLRDEKRWNNGFQGLREVLLHRCWKLHLQVQLFHVAATANCDCPAMDGEREKWEREGKERGENRERTRREQVRIIGHILRIDPSLLSSSSFTCHHFLTCSTKEQYDSAELGGVSFITQLPVLMLRPGQLSTSIPSSFLLHWFFLCIHTLHYVTTREREQVFLSTHLSSVVVESGRSLKATFLENTINQRFSKNRIESPETTFTWFIFCSSDFDKTFVQRQIMTNGILYLNGNNEWWSTRNFGWK